MPSISIFPNGSFYSLFMRLYSFERSGIIVSYTVRCAIIKHSGKIEFSGDTIEEVALETMKNVVTEEDELITVYYGADVSESDAEKLAARLSEAYGECDVEYHSGGQPLYYYLISVE